MWSLVVSVLAVLATPGWSHVGLYYPPARTYALDFLDNARTQWPCGMQRGRGPVTDLEAGSTFVVSWYLGYAHRGGSKLELLMYNDDGSVNTTNIYNLTNGYVGADNMTKTSQTVTLPAEVTSCTNCTIRLVRQALEWGNVYVFWSCADVNIVPPSRYSDSCLGHGTYDATSNGCQCDKTYSGFRCQFKDDCEVDADCGQHGKCQRVTDFSYPQKQCFCQPGYFGLHCEKESPVKSTNFDASLYRSRTLNRATSAVLYYRIIRTTPTPELEVVVQAKTRSYIGFGWKPRGRPCNPYSLRQGASPEGEPEGESEPTRNTTAAAESEPEGGGEPEPRRTTTPLPEGEPEPSRTTTPTPEGEPEPARSTPAPEGEPTRRTPAPEGEPTRSTPAPEGEAEGEPTRSTPAPEGEAEGEPGRTTTPAAEGEPEGEARSTPEPEGSSIGKGTGMNCVDIVIGAAVGQLSRVGDYYTADRSTPRHDEFYGGSQSLTAAVASQSDDGVTTVIFRRPVNAMESTDHAIKDEWMTAIWAHGQVNPDIEYFYQPDEIKYHAGNRGIISINFFDERQPVSNRWSSPVGCTGTACDYVAEWIPDDSSNSIAFSVTAKQQRDRWTGIAFAREPKMENMDVYLGYVDNDGNGVTFDGFTSRQHTKPVRDAMQNMNRAEVKYENGMLTLRFERARDTGDSKDLSLSDNNCYHFIFPIGGGRHSNTDFTRHTETPSISEKRICIGGEDQGPDDVTLTREEYDAMKHRLNAFKVATIVLAVFAGIAIICIIILIRYFIVRQRTANDYELQK